MILHRKNNQHFLDICSNALATKVGSTLTILGIRSDVWKDWVEHYPDGHKKYTTKTLRRVASKLNMDFLDMITPANVRRVRPIQPMLPQSPILTSGPQRQFSLF